MFKNKLNLRIVAMIIACLTVITMFSGCEEKEDPEDNDLATSTVKTVTAQVEGGSSLNSKIDEVRVFAYSRSGNEEIAKGAFGNGGFTITLPDNLASKFLYVWWDEYDIPDGVNISNKSVKMSDGEGVWFVAYKGGEPVGWIYYGSNNTDAILIYVDGDVNITGSGSQKDGDWTWNYSRSVSLKTGWNFVYCTYSENTTSKTQTSAWTTTDPGDLKWIFDENH